jgi:tetratricopeptide (TPR) repeat protein
MRGLWVSFQRQEIPSGWSFVATVAVGVALGLTLPMVVSPTREQTPTVITAVTARVETVKPPTPAALQVHPGLLLDLRDAALGRLLEAPADVETMDSLVRIQRYLAADNSEMLRFGAAVYARAVRAGAQTSEHLTAQAMRLLVLANLLAATQIETQRGGPVSVKLAPPSVATAGLRFQASERVTGPSAPGARMPVAHRPEYFLVVSPPLTIEQGQYQVTALASARLAPVLRRAGDGRVQVQVGAFASRVNAEALAARVRERGVIVSVVAGPAGTVFEPVRPRRLLPSRPQPGGQAVSFDNFMTRGIRLYGTGWYGPALAAFREAARVSPNSARANLWWGRAAFKAARVREARGALERAIALSGDAGVFQQAELLLRVILATEVPPTAPSTE